MKTVVTKWIMLLAAIGLIHGELQAHSATGESLGTLSAFTIPASTLLH
ncbi:MAG: hypothetical protein J7K90_01240 [Desulfuromusa sp.]|nr:hypothetical protein [Desulfuromusa sp.]